ncbi:hypothetical protein B6U99_07455 [Candidatus Geothermarchaeota archaeon ex4572_27]|nr:MAG: hypothetical protein B6U99_07455 [Candidatus Geothermarchaeota archaeon ex4572_27]
MLRWKALMLYLTSDQLKGLEALVRRGRFSSVEEAVKAAVVDLLRRELPVALERVRSRWS